MNDRLFAMMLCVAVPGITALQAQQPFFHPVPPPEDIPWNLITGITQDRLGYMWFASAQGLNRFDGFNVVHYTHNMSDDNSVIDNRAECIYADSEGMIWAGTHGKGIDKFDPVKNVFTHFYNHPDDKTSLINDTVTAILEDHENNIWIGTYGGLERLDSKTGKFYHYTHDLSDPASLSNNHVRVLYEDRQGTIWVGTGSPFINDKGVVPGEGGLNRLDRKSGGFFRYMHKSKDPHSLIDNRVRAIFEDKHGNFWVGTAGDGLHSMDRAAGLFERHFYEPGNPQKLSRPPVRNLFPWCDDHITFITEDAAGALWIGTFSGGISRYDPAMKKTFFYGWQEPHLPGGFNDYNGWCAYSSRDGVLWISTLIGNLFRIDPLHHNFPYYELNEDIGAVYEDKTGIIWIGSENGLIMAQKGGKTIKRYVYDSLDSTSISSNYVNMISKDPDDKFWIATYGGGFNYFDPQTEKFKRYLHDPKNSNSLINNTVVVIQQDNEQNLWIGTEYGLDKMEIKTGRFKHYQHDPADTNSLSENAVRCFLLDRKNQLWIGCSGGINVFKNKTGKFSRYLKGYVSTSLFEDADGVIWASTINKGVFKFSAAAKKFIPFVDPNSGLEIKNVVSITEDDKKNLWLFGTSFIMHLNSKRDTSITYGKDFGVRRYQNPTGRSCKGPSGNILCGDQNGYYNFSPDSITGNPVSPQVILTDFFLGAQTIHPGINSPLKVPVSEAKEISLTYKQNIFSFDFAILHYSNPENNQQLCMLENYDNSWRNIGTERRAFYFNVSPGHYTFRVKGSNNVGIWAEKSIRIDIAPPWWQTWWFWAIVVLAVSFVLYTIVKARVSAVRRSEQSKAKHEKELLELEARALRAQMNPHFIFNCMNSIKSLIQQKDEDKAVNYLTTFSKLLRTILQNSDKREVTLFDELETCRLYTQLESMRFGKKFNYRFVVDEHIDLKSICIPALIIQPFIENAIWHGILPKQDGGNITVTVHKKDNAIYCVVDDDGIGREMSKQNKFKGEPSNHQSKGVHLTQTRLDLDNVLNQRNARVEIVDKKDATGNASGTTVTLIFIEY